MKKMALITTMILCLVLTACGNKEESQTTQEEVAVENTVIEENPEEVVEETEEVEEPVEEVIGDVDISEEGLTMTDMQELELGLDIPIEETAEGAFSSFEGFKILFPSSVYQTKVTDGSVEAQLESIWFILDPAARKNDAPTSAREDRNETLETIGKYVVHKMPRANDKYGLDYSYRIYDTESGNALFITIVINKNSEYQEYGDNLVNEYFPAFEEVLYNNLK